MVTDTDKIIAASRKEQRKEKDNKLVRREEFLKQRKEFRAKKTAERREKGKKFVTAAREAVASTKKAFGGKPGVAYYERGKKEITREVSRRARKMTRGLTALGIMPSHGGYREGAGRPEGSYKYGMPIQQYKRLQAQQRAQYQQYLYDKQMKLRGQGFSPEQITQIEQARTMQQPQVQQQRQVQQVQQVQSQQQIQQTAQQQVIAQAKNLADDELEYRRYLAAQSVSPNTQNILTRLRRTQLKSQRDDVENQRRIKERRMVSDAGNLMKTPFIFNRYNMDLTGVDGTNILMAPNVFKESPNNPHILKSPRFNIMQTKEAGNNLKFF